MIKIKDIPITLRPRELASKIGIKSLSDAEILAIIVNTGTKNKSALDISYDLLRRFGSIEGLSLASIEDLIKIDGIKQVKAIKLLALFELIRRYEKELLKPKIRIDNIYKAIKLILPKCFGIKQEILFLIILDDDYGFIRLVQLYIGTKYEIQLSPKEILQEIVKSGASKVYIAHNHPSNNIKPSKADNESTRMISLLLESFSIEIIDSLIIGNCETYSILTDSIIKNELIIKSK